MNSSTPTTQSGIEKEDYFVHQFNTGCLAQFSYYIESNKEAVIIDPIRDCDMYLKMLEQRGASLKFILETHFHADFVSGHVELNKLTGSQIVFGPNAEPSYSALIVKDHEVLSIGKVGIEVLHTPGHTMESTSYLLIDSEGKKTAVFTGDCLFLGEVGRPDLAVKGDITERDLANLLFDSLQNLKTLPDDVIVYPGHGAGSACGKRISAGTSCIMGNQKKNNYALNDNLSREEFIEIVTSNLPTPPQYFFFDVMLNKTGYESIEKIQNKSLNAITPENFFNMTSSDNSLVVIDTRDTLEAIKNFFLGSYLISLKMTYAIWTATLFQPQQKFILICDADKHKEAITRLARVGYENVIGYVDGGFPALMDYAEKNEKKELIANLTDYGLDKIKETVETFESQGNVNIFDVREISEWESTGIIKGANLVPLGQFEARILDGKTNIENKEGTYALHCKTGGRAAVAGGILKKYGVKNVVFLGGVLNMIEKGVNFVPYKN